jgi:hypothetical protein
VGNSPARGCALRFGPEVFFGFGFLVVMLSDM